VTNGYIAPDDGGSWFLLGVVLSDVDDGIVLNVGLFSNGDIVDVASESGSVPN